MYQMTSDQSAIDEAFAGALSSANSISLLPPDVTTKVTRWQFVDMRVSAYLSQPGLHASPDFNHTPLLKPGEVVLDGHPLLEVEVGIQNGSC